jgi:hypothetical protein
MRKFPKNGTLFIPKNDLITPCGMNKKKLLHDHTMFVWFTPSKIYSHPKMGFFILTRFVFTPCKFCSHHQDFIHTMKCL